jgi:phosphotransferase system HPr (HPr) family protein
MHARPAAILLKLAKQFRSEIDLKKDGKQVPLKSMLNILACSIKCGDTVSVIIHGEDEADAALAMENFFTRDLQNL